MERGATALLVDLDALSPPQGHLARALRRRRPLARPVVLLQPREGAKLIHFLEDR